MNFKELSGWIMVGGHSATRIIVGGNINNIQDRVAFIEKSPRVRISKRTYGIEIGNGQGGCRSAEDDAWLYGEKGSSDYGLDEDSRKWCDDMLVLLGWE